MRRDAETLDDSDAEFEALVKAFCDEGASSVGPNYFRIRRLEFELQRMLMPNLFRNKYDRALDLGCGIGFKALLMSHFAARTDGVDVSEPYHGFETDLPAAERGRQLLRMIGCESVFLEVGDYLSILAGRPNSYDLIYSDYLLEHVPDLPPLCRAMFTSLKPQGTMIHLVPNTHDALIQLSQQNLLPKRSVIRPLLRAYAARFRHGSKRHPKLTLNGWFVPETHSEFLTDFSDQFEVYRLENYVFPLIEAGFQVLSIVPIREHSFAVACQKP